MTQTQDLAFVPGSALEAAEALLDWLDNTIKPLSPRKAIRLPVVVRFEDEHRLGWGAVQVGLSADTTAGALHLDLDDGALGNPLLDTLAADCPKGDACALWMEGYWGALVDMPDFDMPGLPDEGPKRHPFAVLKVVGPVADGDSAAAQVASPAP